MLLECCCRCGIWHEREDGAAHVCMQCLWMVTYLLTRATEASMLIIRMDRRATEASVPIICMDGERHVSIPASQPASPHEGPHLSCSAASQPSSLAASALPRAACRGHPDPAGVGARGSPPAVKPAARHAGRRRAEWLWRCLCDVWYDIGFM